MKVTKKKKKKKKAKLLLPSGHGSQRCCCEQSMKAGAYFSPLGTQGPPFRDILVRKKGTTKSLRSILQECQNIPGHLCYRTKHCQLSIREMSQYWQRIPAQAGSDLSGLFL